MGIIKISDLTEKVMENIERRHRGEKVTHENFGIVKISKKMTDHDVVIIVKRLLSFLESGRLVEISGDDYYEAINYVHRMLDEKE